MTIKFRNRLNSILFLVSLAVFALNIGVFVYREMYYPFFYFEDLPVYISLFFMGFYACVTSLIMNRAFEKTQNSEICFFACFLIACLAETSRLYIPIFDVGETSSTLLIVLGNFTAFSRILAPLSFLFLAIMSGPDEVQNVDRNIVMILVSSLFFAVIIPQNTGVIEPTFRVHIGFDRTVVLIEILTDVCAVIALFVNNLRERRSQKTVVGIIFIIAGFVLSVNGINYVRLGFSIACLSFGTAFYLKTLHAQHFFD